MCCVPCDCTPVLKCSLVLLTRLAASARLPSDSIDALLLLTVAAEPVALRRKRVYQLYPRGFQNTLCRSKEFFRPLVTHLIFCNQFDHKPLPSRRGKSIIYLTTLHKSQITIYLFLQ
ncbi:hypothetical protein CJO88_20355 (plasmid) [Ralstonia solanacearum]|nr:hypothetical protein CJO88_20355 [Ralstonia solanacearum]